MSSLYPTATRTSVDSQQARKMFKTSQAGTIVTMPFTPDASPAAFNDELSSSEQDVASVFSLIQPVQQSPQVQMQHFKPHDRSRSQPTIQPNAFRRSSDTTTPQANWVRSLSIDEAFSSPPQYWVGFSPSIGVASGSTGSKTPQLGFMNASQLRPGMLESLAYPSPSAPYHSVTDNGSRKTPFQFSTPLSTDSLMSPPVGDDGNVAFVSGLLGHQTPVFDFQPSNSLLPSTASNLAAPSSPYLAKPFANMTTPSVTQAAVVAAAVQSAMAAKSMTPRLNTSALSTINELVSCSPITSAPLMTPSLDSPLQSPLGLTFHRRESTASCSPATESTKSKKSHVKKAFCSYPGCNNSYYRNEHLIRHMRTHTGDKPFVCSHEGCGKAFSRSDNYASHLRSHDLAAAQGITTGLRRGGRKRKMNASTVESASS